MQAAEFDRLDRQLQSARTATVTLFQEFMKSRLVPARRRPPNWQSNSDVGCRMKGSVMAWAVGF
jgi:hypothetical protein